MKIAFTGKGGSGKTTIGSLFARQMTEDGRSVLVLDADINQHVVEALAAQHVPKSMGEHIDEIKTYLAGTNERLVDTIIQKTNPPGNGSQFVQLKPDDWFIENFTVKTESGIYVAGAGEIPEGNVGVKCYHGLNGAVELVLGHMIDQSDDVVVVDMTAGADAFSSSLFTKVDALVIVVEPTMKSLSVYDQFKPHADRYDIPLLVVANKVADQSDLDFIRKRVGNPVATFGISSYVKRKERGEEPDWSDVEPGMARSLQDIHAAAAEIPRDWKVVQRRAELMHTRATNSWAGKDTMAHIDADFSLEDAAKHILLADTAQN